MVFAATTGAIDFSKASLLDSRWTAYLRLTLAELTRQTTLDFMRTLHQHYAAFATIPRLEESSFKSLRDSANEALDIIIAKSNPWDKDRVSEAQKDQARAAVQEWEDHYGKLDDPQVQAAIDATVAAVQQHRAEQTVKRQTQEAIWKGQRGGTRKERHRARRMGKHG